MKKRSKRLLAVAIAAVMSCSMITGWANTMTVTKVEVLNDDDSVAATYTDLTNVEVAANQRMQVTLALMSDAAEGVEAVATDGEATFLSYVVNTASADLSDSTIQYVDQATVNEVGTDDEVADGTAVITFRPRATLSTGTFTAQAGGTSVAASTSFNYNVVDALITMTLNADKTEVAKGETVTITVSAETLPADDKVTIEGVTGAVYANGVVTIDTANIAAGTYSVVVKADGYTVPAAVSIKVVDQTYADVENKDDAQNAVNDINVATNPEGNSFTLPTVTVEEQNVRYTVEGSEAVSYDQETGAVTYDPDKATTFAERVAITAEVGGATQGISKTTYVYFVKGDIAFGNVTAIAASDGTDAFASADALENADTNEKLLARAAALNIVLGKADKDSVAKPNETLNWNYDDKISLSEYNIMRHLIKGTEGYEPDTLKTKRETMFPGN